MDKAYADVLQGWVSRAHYHTAFDVSLTTRYISSDTKLSTKSQHNFTTKKKKNTRSTFCLLAFRFRANGLCFQQDFVSFLFLQLYRCLPTILFLTVDGMPCQLLHILVCPLSWMLVWYWLPFFQTQLTTVSSQREAQLDQSPLWAKGDVYACIVHAWLLLLSRLPLLLCEFESQHRISLISLHYPVTAEACARCACCSDALKKKYFGASFVTR